MPAGCARWGWAVSGGLTSRGKQLGHRQGLRLQSVPSQSDCGESMQRGTGLPMRRHAVWAVWGQQWRRVGRSIILSKGKEESGWGIAQGMLGVRNWTDLFL